MKELIIAGDIDSDGTDTIELSIITRNNSAITHDGCDHAKTKHNQFCGLTCMHIIRSEVTKEVLNVGGGLHW